MKKFFFNDAVEIIESKEVIQALRKADRHARKHIRIAINDEVRKINFYNEDEYEIELAIIFIWTKDKILRYDFTPDAPDHSFHAAIIPQGYIAFAVDDTKTTVEGVCSFDVNDAVLGIFKTEAVTFFIAYDGTQKNIGCGYYIEERQASIFKRLFSLFEHTKLETEEEPVFLWRDFFAGKDNE